MVWCDSIIPRIVFFICICKFLSELSRNKGVWLSKKVFWWALGISYGLSMLGLYALTIAF